MTKVLMVCLGNICRSPLAEGILKHKLKNTNIEVQKESFKIKDYFKKLDNIINKLLDCQKQIKELK